jgi:Lrp/AsnC family transcriptional regulator for asnA, asnC and gidA
MPTAKLGLRSRMRKPGEIAMSETATVTVDSLDLAILKRLEEDGRRSFTDIARELDIAVSTVRNRLNAMLENGTVRIIPRVNPHHVGFSAPATISVSVEPARLEEAITEIAAFPEIGWLASVTGEYDLIVDIMCRDVAHLRRFLTERLGKVPGVTRTATSVYLQIHKIALPDVDLLQDESEAPAEAYGPR